MHMYELFEKILNTPCLQNRHAMSTALSIKANKAFKVHLKIHE